MFGRKGWVRALFAEPDRRAERRVAIRVVLAFVIAGLAWVVITDVLLYTFASRPRLVARIETAKGWAFVIVAGMLLYAVTRRSMARFARDQAAISAVVDSIGDGILILGRDQTVLHANPAALRMLRCHRLRDLVGMDASTFARKFRLTRRDGTLLRPDELVSQRVFDEGGPLEHTIVLHRPDGRELVVVVTAAAVRDHASERPDMVVSVLHDVTAAEGVERLRSQLYSATAHALKTPVTIIKTHAQALARGMSTSTEQATSAIVRQCDRIDRLVQNSLVVSRAHTGSLQLFPSEIELGALVERVAGEMREASTRHELRVEVAGSVRVHGDPERLAMAIRDLIDVAFRSSALGSTVTVTLRRHGRDAEIGVRHRPRPAEERMDPSLEDFDEVGVSRRVAATLVEAHGGEIREETAASEAVAWVRLPALGERA